MIDTLLAVLAIPTQFESSETGITEDIPQELSTWKDDALRALARLKSHVSPDCETDRKAEFIFYIAPFVGDEYWTSPAHSASALELLESLGPLEEEVVLKLLTDHVKPLFVASPHPMVNLDSGRKLLKPAGGPHSGLHIEKHIFLCIRAFVAYVSPPLMTLLDDHSAKWRLRALAVGSQFLENVPPDLLRRTGMQDLLMKSFSTSLIHTNNPESPDLIKASVPVLIQLTLKTTLPNSEARFAALCDVLGKNIIGSLWVYASQDHKSIRATYEAIPLVLQQLGIGSARYLSAIIPQLTSHISPDSYEAFDAELMASSIKCLLSVIAECPSRMELWGWKILDAVCKRWVTMKEAAISPQDAVVSAPLLKDVCSALLKTNPEYFEFEYQQLVGLHPSLPELLQSV